MSFSSQLRRFFSASFFLISFLSLNTLADEKAWYENTEINGDIRLRYEGIYKKPGQDTDRERFRLRLGMKSRVNESINFIMRLESGVQDPVSQIRQLEITFREKILE